MSAVVSRLQRELARARAMLDCEAGKSGPWGWDYDGNCGAHPEWTRWVEGNAVTSVRHVGDGWTSDRPELATQQFPYALLAIEAERALVDLWSVTPCPYPLNVGTCARQRTPTATAWPPSSSAISGGGC